MLSIKRQDSNGGKKHQDSNGEKKRKVDDQGQHADAPDALKKRKSSIEEDPRDPPASWPAAVGDFRRDAPLWMEHLCGMSNKFHSKLCELHKAEVKKAGKNKLKLTHYCFTCQKGPLCSYGAENDHKSHGHVVLQVRRTSYKASVLVSDLRKVDPSVDYGGVVEYKINSDTVFFLEFKHQDKYPKGASVFCRQCGRCLPKSKTEVKPVQLLCQPSANLFCCLPCKGLFMRGDGALHPEHASLSWIKIADTDSNADGRCHRDDDVGPGKGEEVSTDPGECSIPSLGCEESSSSLEQLQADSEASGQIPSPAEESAALARVVVPAAGAPAFLDDDCPLMAIMLVNKQPRSTKKRSQPACRAAQNPEHDVPVSVRESDNPPDQGGETRLSSNPLYILALLSVIEKSRMKLEEAEVTELCSRTVEDSPSSRTVEDSPSSRTVEDSLRSRTVEDSPRSKPPQTPTLNDKSPLEATDL